MRNISNAVIVAGLIGTTGIIIWKYYQRRHNRIRSIKLQLQRILCYGKQDVHVFVLDTLEDWQKVSPNFIKEVNELKIVGFDAEWYNHGKIALLQLATPNGLCLLIRLNRLTVVPDDLKNLLKSNYILKIGVGIKEDCAKILLDYNCECNNWVDVRHFVRSRRQDCKKLGMAGIAEEVLKLTLDKDWKIRASDWEEGVNKDGKLSQRQVEYATNDALVAQNVAIQLTIDDIENKRWLWDTSMNVNSYKDVVVMTKAICQSYTELDFKNKGKPATNDSTNNSRSTSHPRKLDPAKQRHRNAIRKEPLYHNIRLEAPDGQQLCVTDAKKAKWYVLKGLGECLSFHCESFS